MYCWPYICCIFGRYCWVVDRHCYFFLVCRIVVCSLRKSFAYFIALSPRLSVTHSTCLGFYFLLSGPGVRVIWSPSISFCLYVVVISVYRASNVWCHQLPCAPVAVCKVPRRTTGSSEWSWTISVNVREENHDSRTPYISLVTALFTVYTQ